jgi:hypothetical protein
MAGYQGTGTRDHAHEALAAAIESERRETFHVGTGKVTGYGAGQRAGVQPSLTRKFGDKVLTAPPLADVPVLHPRGGGFIFHVPLAAGDEVALIFADRSLDKTGADGSASDGRPGRMHSISDAMAIPASHSASGAADGLPDGKMHVGKDDGSAGLQVGADGTADVVAKGDTLLTMLEDFVKMFRDHLTEGAPHDKIAAAEGLLTRVKAMRGA